MSQSILSEVGGGILSSGVGFPTPIIFLSIHCIIRTYARKGVGDIQFAFPHYPTNQFDFVHCYPSTPLGIQLHLENHLRANRKEEYGSIPMRAHTYGSS